MEVAYELWEMQSGNLMGSFPTQDEALQVLAKAVSRYGSSYTDTIMLTYEHGDESKELASGAELADLARRATADLR
jgi:hypothetical protein